jgi:ribosome biogenesis GTPase / thiamine phosphate phosphatase
MARSGTAATSDARHDQEATVNQLELLGWCSFFANQVDVVPPGCEPGRVTADHGQEVAVAVAGGAVSAATRPKDDTALRPTVGDWVLVAPGGPRDLYRIARLLARRTALIRKVAGAVTEQQVLAANVDVVLVVMGLDGDANVRRLERWIAAVWESGAEPAVLLNKADLAADPAAWLATVAEIAPGIGVHLVSAVTGDGTEVIGRLLAGGRTGVLVGSSGVGKSTLINRLLGEERQRVAGVRRGDNRGRHTTASRELFRVPGGGLLIDGPGIRELQLWSADDALDATFADIAALAASCRFRDCRHSSEPGCVVCEAVACGAIAAERLTSFRKLRRELESLAARQNGAARLEEKRRWRAIHRALRRMPKKG